MDFSDLPETPSTVNCVELYRLVKRYWFTQCQPRIIRFSDRIREGTQCLYEQLDDCLFPPASSNSPEATDINGPNIDNTMEKQDPQIRMVYNRAPYTPPEPIICSDVSTQTNISKQSVSLTDSPLTPTPVFRRSIANLPTSRNTKAHHLPSDSDSESDWERIDCVV